MACDSTRIQSEVTSLVEDEAKHLTKDLSCVRSNSCTLNNPDVRCCKANGGPTANDTIPPTGSGSFDCPADRSRTKRGLAADWLNANRVKEMMARDNNNDDSDDHDDEFLAIDVVLRYHGKLDKGL